MAKASFTRRPGGTPAPAPATPAPAVAQRPGVPQRPVPQRRTAPPPEPAPVEEEAQAEEVAAEPTPVPQRPVRRTATPAAQPVPAPARQAPQRRQAAPSPEPEPLPDEVGGESDAGEYDQATEEVATNTQSALAVPTEMVQGQIDRSDINTPGLKLVQSVGPMSELFDPGCIVLTQGGENSVVLVATEQDIQLTVLRIRKQFIENLDWDSEERPRIFDTIEDVQAAGGWIEWHNNERPPFSPMATALVVVSMPEDMPEDQQSFFPFEFEGGRYALALWTMKGTAYTRAAKNIFTASVYSLTPAKGGLPIGCWVLQTKRVKAGSNMVYAPVLKQSGTWDPAFVEFLTSLGA